MILLKMSLITVMNQKLSRITMTQSSIRDAVKMLNNYMQWTCVSNHYNKYLLTCFQLFLVKRKHSFS